MSGSGTEVTVSGLANGTAYTFTVTATNGAGTGPASASTGPVTPKPPTYPAVVTDLQVTPGNAQVAVAWRMPVDDGAADITTTVIQVVRASDNSSKYVYVPAPATTATIAQLLDGVAYRLIVYVVNKANYRGWTVRSADFRPKAGPQPAPPVDVTARPAPGRATVDWNPPADDGGSPVTGYTVTTYTAANVVVGTPADVAATGRSSTATGLTNGTSYYFGVSAKNAAGIGPEWFSNVVTPAVAPGAPTAVITYPSNGAIFVSWAPPAANGGSDVVSYDVTASGPAGTQTQTVSSANALFSGLANGGSYTFTVAASNPAATGPASQPSVSIAPSGEHRKATGRVDSGPAAKVPTPGLVYDERRVDPIISGDGRFVFYRGYVTASQPDGTYVGEVENGWFRYDITTGATRPVWYYQNGSGLMQDGQDLNRIASASYDGSTFSSYGGNNLYVWKADPPSITLASANASGGPTNGLGGLPNLTADGSALYFTVTDGTDMADRSPCPAYGEIFGGGWVRPNKVDLYRFDTRTHVLTRVPLNMTVPNVTVSCVASWGGYAMSISADGSRIASGVDFTTTVIRKGIPESKTERGTAAFEPGVGGGSGRLFVPQGCCWFYGRPALSDDGRILTVGMNGSDGPLVRLDPTNASSPIVAFADGKKITDRAISGDGRFERVIIRENMDANAQTGLIDLSSGELVVSSQVNGRLSSRQGTSAAFSASSVDSAGRRMVIGTTSANMLGRNDCGDAGGAIKWKECASGIVVVDLVAGTVGVVPDRTLGCWCGSSLGGAVPLQGFAGNGVNTGTGAYTTAVDDVKGNGIGSAFVFRRTYNSAAGSKSAAQRGFSGSGNDGLLGPGWSSSYGMALSVASNGDATLISEDGTKAVFVKQPNGSYRTPTAARSVLAADSNGFTLATPDSQVDRFDTDGRLVSIADRNGRATTFGYVGTRLVSATEAGGRQFSFEYDSVSGHLYKITTPDGRATVYGYDASGRLISVQDSVGATTAYAYDNDNRLTTVTDARGNIQVRNEYDPATGRVVQQTQSGGAQPRIAWDPVTEVATTTDVDGRTTRDRYVGNVLVGHEAADGGTTSYEYDDRLNLVGVSDPNGNTMRMTYDAFGNMLTRKAPYPMQFAESWTYDAHRNVLTHTDGRGGVTSNTYDSANRVTSSTDSQGGTTRFTYTPAGQVATVVDATGNTTTSGYDAAGNLTTKTDPLGNRSTFTYDAAGRVLTSVEARGNAQGANPADYTTTYTYDGTGRIRTRTDANGHAVTNTYDSAGNLTSVRDPLGNSETYTYDTFNRRATATDPSGRTSTFAYSPQGEIVGTTNPAGERTTYGYDKSGRLLSTTTARGNVAGADPAAFTRRFGYDANGNRTSDTDPLGNVSRTAYDSLNRPVASTDPLGRTSTTTYDANGNVTAVADAAGKLTTFTYDGADRRLVETDPTGATTTYAYDAEGRRIRRTTALGAVITWTYDQDGRPTEVTDARGNAPGANRDAYTSKRTYDPAGRLLSTTDPMGNRTTYTYDGAGRLTTIADAVGGTTTSTYDAADRAIAIRDPNGHVGTTEFDPSGRILATVDPMGNRSSRTYDAAGRQASTTTPRGNVPGATPAAYTTKYGYDPEGRRITTTGPTGGVTRTAYDALGRATAVTDPLGHVTTTTYDAVGNAVSTKDPSGGVVTSTYDVNNRLATATDQLGKQTVYERDAVGRLSARRDPSGTTTSWTYDAEGRTREATDPRGNAPGAVKANFTTTYGYDLVGNTTTVTKPSGAVETTMFDALNSPTAVRDPIGRTTDYAYDALHRVTLVRDPTGATTTATYDPVGNLVARRDANDHTATYGYDAANRQITATDPLGRSVSYTHNADGQRTGTVNARGQTVTNDYDADGRLLNSTYSDGTPAKAYTYDVAGRMKTAVDAMGSHTFGYDDNGRTTGVTQPTGGSFTYAYDPTGQITSRGYPDGTTIAYTYDADGRQTGQTMGGKTTTYAYDLAGNLTDTTYPVGTGAKEHVDYDATNRLTAMNTTRSGGALAAWQVTRNLAGEPTKVHAVRDASAYDTTYTYDPAGRLTSACPATGTNGLCTSGVPGLAGAVYGYDAVGNRLSQVTSAAQGAPATTTYAYDAADELTHAVGPEGNTTYQYDADGNQTGVIPPTGGSRVPQTRAFDAAGRVTSQSMPSGDPISYTYDAFDNRAREQRGGETVDLAWDTNGSLPLLATRKGAGATISFGYDPFQRASATVASGDPTYLLHDWREGVTDTSDAVGHPRGTGSADYDPFGNTSTDLHALGSGDIGFDGQTLNSDGGTYNLRARQYDPTTGRFLGRDPAIRGTTQSGLSAYPYADNAPTLFDDPTGRTPQVPGGPDGFDRGGDRDAHDFAVNMAADQMTALYGAKNVYADIPGRYGWRGRRWGVDESGTPGANTGYPDLVVRGATGTGYGVWDIKSAWGDGLGDNTDQIESYVRGIERETGTYTDLGHEIVPQYRYWPQEKAIVSIFNATDWETYATPAAKRRNPKPPVASNMYEGIILYTKFNLYDKNHDTSGLPTIDEIAQSQKGREKEVITCYPAGVSARNEPLRMIGTSTGADISQLTSVTTTPVRTIGVVNPDPYPMPPPPPVRSSPRFDADHHGKSGGGSRFGWKKALGLTVLGLTAVTVTVVAPEVAVPGMMAAGSEGVAAQVLTRAMMGLVA